MKIEIIIRAEIPGKNTNYSKRFGNIKVSTNSFIKQPYKKIIQTKTDNWDQYKTYKKIGCVAGNIERPVKVQNKIIYYSAGKADTVSNIFIDLNFLFQQPGD